MGVAHAAKELQGKRVLISDHSKSRVGIINRVEKTDDERNLIFLAVEGAVAIIDASEVKELEERPQDFFITVDVIEAGSFIFWLKNFVNVDVLYTIAPKRLRVSAAVRSAIDPELSFTATEVKITHQDLASVDSPESLQAYAVQCQEVKLSPDQTGFMLFSAAVQSIELINTLRFTGQIKTDNNNRGLNFNKAQGIVVTLANAEDGKPPLDGLIGKATLNGSTYQIDKTVFDSSDNTWTFTASSNALVYGSYDWKADQSDKHRFSLSTESESGSKSEALVTYKDTTDQQKTKAFYLGIEAGETVLVTELPSSFTRVSVKSSTDKAAAPVLVPVIAGSAKISVTDENQVISFDKEISRENLPEAHSTFPLVGSDGTIAYHRLIQLPEALLTADVKALLLAYKQTWEVYKQVVAKELTQIQALVDYYPDKSNYLALIKLIQSGQVDSVVNQTIILQTPALNLIEALRQLAIAKQSES
jgi:hypothetical protein